MVARNALIFRWTVYAAAALLCVFAQTAVLQRVHIWGVIPFLYPAVAAIPATFEGPVPGTAFALAVGVLCDTLLPAPIPCFYTLIFPVAGLCAALLTQSILPAGVSSSLASTAIAFLLTGLFGCLLLWFRGKTDWETGMLVALRECLVTLPFTLPMTALFRAVHRRTHRDD